MHACMYVHGTRAASNSADSTPIGKTHSMVLRPLGDQSHEFVRTGNKIVSRTVMIALLLYVKGVLALWEQPRGNEAVDPMSQK